MHLQSLGLVAAIFLASQASSALIVSTTPPPKPIVFWHGMGDSAHSEGMTQLFDTIHELSPDVFIHSITLSANEGDDRNAGFFGNINTQLETVCQDLAAIPELEGGFNAIGFSQGGQFLRAYVQRCNNPPIRNLVTVGSQHQGISDIPGCEQSDLSCKMMRSIAKSGAYSSFARDRIIQAQYFKDPTKLSTYLERNIFLPDINNERLDSRNETYKENLMTLNKLVMFMFTEDITVKPKETSWFGYRDELGDLWDMRETDLYKQDWIGLKTLDEDNKLVFEELEGPHMHFSLEQFMDKMVIPYLLEIGGDEPGDEDQDEDRRHGGKKHHHKGKHGKHHGQGHRHHGKNRHGKGRDETEEERKQRHEILLDNDIDGGFVDQARRLMGTF